MVDTFQLQVSLFEKVTAVHPPAASGRSPASGGREGNIAPFVVESQTSRGVTRIREARNVVLAMGYYTQPNMLNIPGEDLPHVTHFYKEAHHYYRQRVVIVGGKNSAAEAALEIHRAGGHVTMVHRGPGFGDSVKYWVKPDIENRVKEGSIAAHFNANVVEIRSSEVVLDSGVTLPAEHVLLLTGYRADPEFMRRIGVTINRRNARAEVQRRHLRDQRTWPVRRRWSAGGEEDRNRLHRERPVPWRGDREDACFSSVRLKPDATL